MKIELKKIKIRDLVKDFIDNDEEGVYGYGGKLNIRPKYQREFIYKDKQRDSVIDTVFRNYPLNSIYWSMNDDGTLEVLDGQQRILSICQFVNNEFSIKSSNLDELPRFFENLTETEKRAILEYQLTVYFCRGNDQEKLDWFRIINIAGIELTEQELKNAVYSGSWVTDAKRYFSKMGCPASHVADGYLTGNIIRQDYLETAIKWVSKGNIEKYMSEHQNDTSSEELWKHFNNVIKWVKDTFPVHRPEMKHVDWGTFYANYHDKKFDPRKFEKRISKLLANDEVQKKSGIWPYILTGCEKYLNIRTFSDNQKREAFETQGGKCANCGKKFQIGEMEADHIDPWHKGGKTIPENCQILCKPCNRRKSGK